MKKLVYVVAVAFSAALVSCGGNAAKTDDAVVTETVEVEVVTPCDSNNCCNDSAACCNDSAACCADTTAVANN